MTFPLSDIVRLLYVETKMLDAAGYSCVLSGALVCVKVDAFSIHVVSKLDPLALSSTLPHAKKIKQKETENQGIHVMTKVKYSLPGHAS